MACIYCNSNLSSERDHVIPKSWTGNNSFAERYVVPCCKECNTLLGNAGDTCIPLGNAGVHTVEERAAFLYVSYSKKYKSLLNTPDWSKDELKDITGSLGKQIISKEKKKKIINNKLLNLRNCAGCWLVDL